MVHGTWPEHDHTQSTMHANIKNAAKHSKIAFYPQRHPCANLETTARFQIATVHCARLHALTKRTRGNNTVAKRTHRTLFNILLAIWS